MVTCPACGRASQHAPELLGTTSECPECGNVVTVWPDAHTPPRRALPPQVIPQRLPPVVPKKACPFCGEEVNAVAVKCKHCGEFFDREREAPAPPEIHNTVYVSPTGWESLSGGSRH
jgi:uncharacterized Zn finger protein